MEISSDEVMAYRLVAPRYVNTALSGEGAKRNGGRWNSRGIPMVYLSFSRALAALELLVHLPTPESRMIPRRLVEVAIPKDLIGGKLYESEGWRSQPPESASFEQGDDWQKANTNLAVTAPSAIIPEESNLLLNPNHPDMARIRVVQIKPFSFDTRLRD